MTGDSHEAAANNRRHDDLLSAARSVLLIVDVQEKLLPAIAGSDQIAVSIRYLTHAASLLDVPVIASEQYPKGLGPTVADIRERISAQNVFEKMRFSAADGYKQLRSQPDDSFDLTVKRDQVIVTGIESHICILQTALDLLAAGLRVCVVADAVGSRRSSDHAYAMQRLGQAGVALATSESVVFEWCEVAGTDVFRQISRLTRERDATRRE